MSLIIGIHNTGILSSAAVLIDGQLAFGCAEERLSRAKYDKYFPRRAIAACLKHAGARINDVETFAIGWNPAINVAQRYRAGQSEWPAHPGARFSSNPNHLLPLLEVEGLTDTEQHFLSGEHAVSSITYVTHHLAHCSNAYYLSGYEDAAILSCDGYGERTTTAWAVGRGRRIKMLRETSFPHSLGSFYSAITQHLGFRPDLDEWKLMGAAAYGDSTRFKKALASMVSVGGDGDFRLDLNYFSHFDFDSRFMFSDRGRQLLGSPRSIDAPMEQVHFDLAAAAQAIMEDILFASLGWLKKETGLDRLCFAGGVAQNVLFNGKVSLSGLFKEIYVPFAADDSGNSIGAALWCLQKNGRPFKPSSEPVSPFIGTSYEDAEIEKTLKLYGLRYDRPARIADAVAEKVEQGQVVGYFQGRMEFGQRALGSRSILADARRAEMKDRINAAVKFRESFRPFAPAVLKEHLADYFVAPSQPRCEYMERALPVRPEKASEIPAGVHADGTCRVQAVSSNLNGAFHQVISAFHRRTGTPVVLNTSFNLNGEPIVESPTDAVRTFFSSGMTALALGSFMLAKN